MPALDGVLPFAQQARRVVRPGAEPGHGLRDCLACRRLLHALRQHERLLGQDVGALRHGGGLAVGGAEVGIESAAPVGQLRPGVQALVAAQPPGPAHQDVRRQACGPQRLRDSIPGQEGACLLGAAVGHHRVVGAERRRDGIHGPIEPGQVLLDGGEHRRQLRAERRLVGQGGKRRRRRAGQHAGLGAITAIMREPCPCSACQCDVDTLLADLAALELGHDRVRHRLALDGRFHPVAGGDRLLEQGICLMGELVALRRIGPRLLLRQQGLAQQELPLRVDVRRWALPVPLR